MAAADYWAIGMFAIMVLVAGPFIGALTTWCKSKKNTQKVVLQNFDDDESCCLFTINQINNV